MGGEFGQYQEWSESRSLDWHLLQYADHQRTKQYVKELNHFYLKESPFWERDFAPDGFSWIECDDNESSVVSFLRRSEEKELLFVCNFTPNTYFEFRLGVPQPGSYREVFNSDEQRFGGSGVKNTEPLESEEIPWNRCQYSVNLKVPPLGMVVLERNKLK